MAKAASITSTDPGGQTTTSYTSANDGNVHAHVANLIHRGHTNIVVFGHDRGVVAAGGGNIADSDCMQNPNG